jgi:hypothetical protein
MKQLTLQTHVGPDGVLNLHVPIGFSNVDLDVVLVVHPISAAVWPEGYFEQTYGAFTEQPLARDDQGTYEARDQLS